MYSPKLTVQENNRIIVCYEKMFIRQVNSAYESKEMDEVTYWKFMSERCEAETTEGIYDYFQQLFIKLMTYHQERLQAQIIKGAEYIESIGTKHPHYRAALRKYETLCQQLQESKERER
ncbi:hypothetical protein ACP8HI_04380 [Paenibacillus sp. FA6]|uniref:hypothetical protein n=1 Tax=Paenibacillus sp. FA6 TaxID=3413029 RepID=UPI003F6582D5